MAAPFTFPVAQAVPFDGSDVSPVFSSENVKDAIIEARNTAQGKARVSISCIMNGTVGNGTWIGYSNLVPSDETPIVLPWNCKLVEVSFSNNKTSVDGDLDFYKNGTASGNIVFTENFSNVNRVKSFTPNIDFVSGDLLRPRWDDQGQNPSDMALILFFILT